MSDPNSHPHDVENFGDLPIQPTGSGPADLEIAYEQMRLADGGDAETGPGDALPATDAAIPTDDGSDAAESSAHPS